MSIMEVIYFQEKSLHGEAESLFLDRWNWFILSSNIRSLHPFKEAVSEKIPGCYVSERNVLIQFNAFYLFFVYHLWVTDFLCRTYLVLWDCFFYKCKMYRIAARACKIRKIMHSIELPFIRGWSSRPLSRSKTMRRLSWTSRSIHWES